MALNFDVTPYYDDFDPTKNYHRILFKPGVAVQARELTQSQTILQDQISKFGSGIFVDGSNISGGNISIDNNVITCKVTSASSGFIKSLNGLYVVGSDSGFVAKIISVDTVNYYLNTKLVSNVLSINSGETLNFFSSQLEALIFSQGGSSITPLYTTPAVTSSNITRTASGTYLGNILSVPTSNISVGDQITYGSINFYTTVTSIIDSNNLTVNRTLPQDLNSVLVTITSVTSAPSTEVSIDSGVWFTGGFFVGNPAESIIPQPLTINPSCVIGFEVDEYRINSAADPSLLDPAIGASNYQAPGADRYQISLNLVTKPYVDNQTVANLTTNKFIELVRINNGVTENITNTPIFSDIETTLAQNLYDQSGNFIVQNYNLLMGHAGKSSTQYVTSTITSGKAYINGYPVTHIAPTNYNIEKARDTSNLSNQDIVTYYGNYVRANNINGEIINFQNGTSVELHNVVFGKANSNTKIGTAFVRNFDYDSGYGSGTEYKIFLSSVSLINNNFSNVSSLIIPGSGGNYSSVTFSANTVTPALIDSNYNSLIFPLPQNNIANVSNINYVTRRYFSAPTFVNGTYTINTNGSNEIFQGGSGAISSAQRQLNFSVVTTSASGSYPAGKFIPMDQANVSITINNTGTPQATINIAGGFTGSATIYATISVTNDIIKNKVLNTNHFSLLSANTLNTNIDVGYSDIYNFSGIYELGNTVPFLGNWSSSTAYTANSAVIYGSKVYECLLNNINQSPNTATTYWTTVNNNISNYITDNGQRDTFYDHGHINNISGSPKGNVVVVFDYFTHSGGKGCFTLNSYPVDYSRIPSFTSQQYGSTYALRDVLDFRPRRTDGIGTIGLDNYQLPAPFQNVFANYGYYLSRIDKIALYPNGQFKTIRGVSSYVNPIPPADATGALTLFTLNIPAYTYSANSIVVSTTNLRRYTMADIGVLDSRITNLENYTSLSILENQITGSDVTDSTGQNLLFKNGYLVDGFTGSSVADVNNPDYIASIDPVSQLCRPFFESRSYGYTLDITQGNFINSRPGFTPSTNEVFLTQPAQNGYLSLNNDIVTFSYDEIPLVYQNVATEIINVNPFNVINFVGNIILSPSSDVWYSTQSAPQITVVNDDQSAWIAAATSEGIVGTNYGYGTQWNDWQFNWTGQSTDSIINSSNQVQVTRDTTAITSAITAQGLNAALTSGPITVTTTQNIISNAVIPYCRSIPIAFNITGMSPYTQVYCYMGGLNISSCVLPTTFNGGIYNIDIINTGSGYTNGNSYPLTITGNCTTPAIATANVSGGTLVGINIISPGSGYKELPTITMTGSATSQAILSANSAGTLGSPLITNMFGGLCGVIVIPNQPGFQIPTGTIQVVFSDNPLQPALAASYATTSFYAQGTLETVQTTVTSVRPPISVLNPPPPPPPRSPTPTPNTTPPPVEVHYDTSPVPPTPVPPTPTPPPPRLHTDWIVVDHVPVIPVATTDIYLNLDDGNFTHGGEPGGLTPAVPWYAPPPQGLYHGGTYVDDSNNNWVAVDYACNWTPTGSAYYTRTQGNDTQISPIIP